MSLYKIHIGGTHWVSSKSTSKHAAVTSNLFSSINFFHMWNDQTGVVPDKSSGCRLPLHWWLFFVLANIFCFKWHVSWFPFVLCSHYCLWCRHDKSHFLCGINTVWQTGLITWECDHLAIHLLVLLLEGFPSKKTPPKLRAAPSLLSTFPLTRCRGKTTPLRPCTWAGLVKLD